MDAGGSWGCGFAADAEEAAAEAQIGVGRVVESVGFEDAALVDGAQGFYRANRGVEVGDGELDFDFGVCFSRLGHGEVYGKSCSRRCGRYCQRRGGASIIETLPARRSGKDAREKSSGKYFNEN